MSGTQSNAIARTYDALSGKNRIINGNGIIQQRGNGVFTTGINGYGGPDRWRSSNGGSAGGQFTQSQSTLVYNGVTYPCILQTVNTVLTTLATNSVWEGFSQAIESVTGSDLLGKNITLSFIFKTSVAGTYSVSLRDGTTANSYVTSFVAQANTPTLYSFTIPIPGTLTSLGVTNTAGLYLNIAAQNQATFQTSNLGAWQSGNFVSATGAISWGAVSGATIAITNVQVESGNVATPFERRHISVETLMCQRYYQVFQGNIVSYNTGTTFNGTIWAIHGVPMRTASPTLTATNTSSVGGYAGALTTGTNAPNSWFLYFSSSATAGQYCAWQLIVNAEI